MADSWLIDGNCNNCRRKNYCSKSCTKARDRRHRITRNHILDSTGAGQILDMLNGGSRERTEQQMDIVMKNF